MISRVLSILLLTTCLVSNSGKAQVIPAEIDSSREAEVIRITLQKLDQVLKDKNGVPMLQVQGNIPVITIGGNQKATKKMNDFYQNKKKAFEVQQAIDFKQAQEDYKGRSEEERAYWEGYGLGMSYMPERLDEKVISLVENNDEYTGGAHPNNWRYAQNFDPNTGRRLTLKDITTDEKAAITFINQELLKQTNKYEYKEYFFEGYEKNIKDILTEDTWYLSDNGFVVISNEYIISPHAVGILEFTIPYEVFPYLKKEYRPLSKGVPNEVTSPMENKVY